MISTRHAFTQFDYILTYEYELDLNMINIFRVSHILQKTVKHGKRGKFWSYCMRLPCNNYFITIKEMYLAWYSENNIKKQNIM